MKYKNPVEGVFIDRPNRFIAHVDIDGMIETVHVKNTGRCRELLIPGASVVLDKSENPNRKTAYDLVCVHKPNLGWVNIDSQAPNKVMEEYFRGQDYTFIKPEYKYGDSRVDFYLERGAERFLVEVKSCTLEIDGKGYFPDAPTERGLKHIKELIKSLDDGFTPALCFVIAMEKITEVLPNEVTHPEFRDVFYEAIGKGVMVWNMPCRVFKDSLEVIGLDR